MRIRQSSLLFTSVCVLVVSMQSFAQTNWEGTAVVGRYGEFPPGGLFVASNTFPLNSMIDVTNLRTGDTARLIVAKDRTDPGVFLLLSQTAADELGIPSGSSAVVRARPVQLPGLTAVDPNQDLPFHPDPDVNPAATFGDPNESIITPRVLEPAEATTESPSIAVEERRDGPEPVVETPPPVEVEPSETVTAERTDSAPEILPAAEPRIEQPPITATPSPAVAMDPEPSAPRVADPTVDEHDVETPVEVVGVTPPIAPPVQGNVAEPSTAHTVETPTTPEISMPRTNPQTRPPSAVPLNVPPEPAADAPVEVVESTEPVAPAEAEMVVQAPRSEERVPDPLDERLSAIGRQLALERVTDDPVQVTPTDDGIVAPEPMRIAGDERALPPVNVDAALDSEVTDPFPTAPSDIGAIAELPIVEDSSVPDVVSPPPASPALAEAELDLPLAAVASDEPIEVAEGATADALRPSLIPEDAIVTLEPAEYRSPEPPTPNADELSPDATVPPVEEPVDVAIAEPGVPDVEATQPVPSAVAAEVPPVTVTVEDPAPAVVLEPAPAIAPAADEPALAVVSEPTPTTEPAVTGTADLAWARANLPLVAALDRGSYIQVAAFTNARSVRRTVDSLGGGFPVAVVSNNGNGGPVYRVFLGPLSEDEKGTALFTVRNRGFRDAFIRQES